MKRIATICVKCGKILTDHEKHIRLHDAYWDSSPSVCEIERLYIERNGWDRNKYIFAWCGECYNEVKEILRRIAELWRKQGIPNYL